MRALLGLMIVVLFSGCSTTPAQRLTNCNKMRSEGADVVWLPSQNQCKFRTGFDSAESPLNNVPEPIIDKGTATFDPAQYATDLTACRGYANQVGGQAADGAIGGAVAGALFGAIVDSSLNTSGGARAGAMTGALSGGLRGNANAHQGRALVVRKCLAGRGYSVLDM